MSSALLQAQVRKFLKSELLPIVDEINKEGVFPDSVFRKFFKAGFGTAFFPEKWGGNDDLGEYVKISEELGRMDMGFALSVLANSVLFGNNVLNLGTEAQKQRYLPSIIDGTKIGCWALTEPSGGSDATGIQATAEKKKNSYIINGSKTFITNAPVADYFIVLTRLKGTEFQGIQGGCAFVLEKGQPGLSLGKPLDKMGHKTSPTGEVFLQNCEVSADALLGQEGGAFVDMKRSLDVERAVFSSVSIGLVDELLKIMIQYASGRKQFGKPILEYQLIQEKIAQIGAEFDTLKIYAARVVQRVQEGKRVTKEAAILKYLFSKLLVRAADEAIQVLGGYGYMTEYRVERYYRDAKLYEIGGGTSEIQKLIIAKEVIREFQSRAEQ